jgi:hypothetical protein
MAPGNKRSHSPTPASVNHGTWAGAYPVTGPDRRLRAVARCTWHFGRCAPTSRFWCSRPVVSSGLGTALSPEPRVPLSDHPPGAWPAPAGQRTFGLGFAARTRMGWAHGPGQDGTIVPSQAAVPSGEEENKGIRAAAGGQFSALNLVKARAFIREVSKGAPGERRVADRTIRLVRGTRPRDPARSRRPVPAEGLRGSVAGLVIVAMAYSPQITRRRRPVPPAHPVRHQRRAGGPGAAAHRSELASRMSRHR